MVFQYNADLMVANFKAIMYFIRNNKLLLQNTHTCKHNFNINKRKNVKLITIHIKNFKLLNVKHHKMNLYLFYTRITFKLRFNINYSPLRFASTREISCIFIV